MKKSFLIITVLLITVSLSFNNAIAAELLIAPKSNVKSTSKVLGTNTAGCSVSGCCGEECPINAPVGSEKPQSICTESSLSITHGTSGRTLSQIPVELAPLMITYPNQIGAGYGVKVQEDGKEVVYEIKFKLKEGRTGEYLDDYSLIIGYPSMGEAHDIVKSWATPGAIEGEKELVLIQEGLCNYDPNNVTADNGPYWTSLKLEVGGLQETKRSNPGVIISDLLYNRDFSTGQYNANQSQRYAAIGLNKILEPYKVKEKESKIAGYESLRSSDCIEQPDFSRYTVVNDSQGRKIYLPSSDYVATVSSGGVQPDTYLGKRISGPVVSGTSEMNLSASQVKDCVNPATGKPKVCPTKDHTVILDTGQVYGPHGVIEGYNAYAFDYEWILSLYGPQKLEELKKASDSSLSSVDRLLKNFLVTGYYAHTDCKTIGTNGIDNIQCVYSDPMYVLAFLLKTMAYNTPDQNLITVKDGAGNDVKITIDDAFMRTIESHWISLGTSCSGRTYSRKVEGESYVPINNMPSNPIDFTNLKDAAEKLKTLQEYWNIVREDVRSRYGDEAYKSIPEGIIMVEDRNTETGYYCYASNPVECGTNIMNSSKSKIIGNLLHEAMHFWRAKLKSQNDYCKTLKSIENSCWTKISELNAERLSNNGGSYSFKIGDQWVCSQGVVSHISSKTGLSYEEVGKFLDGDCSYESKYVSSGFNFCQEVQDIHLGASHCNGW